MFQQIMLILSAVETLMPIAIKLVDSIEAQFPQSGLGAQKLDMVKNALASAAAVDAEAHGVFEQAWPALKAFIDGTVAIRKALAARPAA